jgi:hypothetical protein
MVMQELSQGVRLLRLGHVGAMTAMNELCRERKPRQSSWFHDEFTRAVVFLRRAAEQVVDASLVTRHCERAAHGVAIVEDGRAMRRPQR